jgi:hypothetical protein
MSPKVFCLTFGAHFSVSYLLSDRETFFWCLLIYLFSYLFFTIYHLQRSDLQPIGRSTGLCPIYSAAIYQLYLHIAIGAVDDGGRDVITPIFT